VRQTIRFGVSTMRRIAVVLAVVTLFAVAVPPLWSQDAPSGILPAKTLSVTLKVPTSAPYSVPLPGCHDYDLGTLKVSLGKQAITVALPAAPAEPGGEASVRDPGPGEVSVTPERVLKFHESAKGQPVSIEVDHRPRRVAVFLPESGHDSTRREALQMLLNGLTKVGHEPVSGPEVDSVVSELSGTSLKALKSRLNCAWLLICRLESDSGYMPAGGAHIGSYMAALGTRVAVFDLNTGQVLVEMEKSDTDTGAFISGEKKLRSNLLKRCLRPFMQKIGAV
jgi:hypothetical protein